MEGLRMLQRPTYKKGYWIYTEKGFEIYDCMDRLVDIEDDFSKFEQIIAIIDDDNEFSSYEKGSLQIGDKGINNYFETEETQDEKQSALDEYFSKCHDCEKELPKRYYSVKGEHYCGRCYKKKDTFINRIKIQNL
jgi:hypothetical protein